MTKHTCSSIKIARYFWWMNVIATSGHSGIMRHFKLDGMVFQNWYLMRDIIRVLMDWDGEGVIFWVSDKLEYQFYFKIDQSIPTNQTKFEEISGDLLTSLENPGNPLISLEFTVTYPKINHVIHERLLEN